MVARRHKGRDGIVYAIGHSGVSIPTSERNSNLRDGFGSSIEGTTKVPPSELACESGCMYLMGNSAEEPYCEHYMSGYAVAGDEVGGVCIARRRVR